MRRLLAAAVLVGSCAVFALARAGGGESYGGRSSYSYGGSGDSGELLAMFLSLYLNFVFHHPLIGFPLTLFVLYKTRVLLTEMNSGPVRPLSGGADQ